VLSYTDSAEATLGLENGSGRFIEVRLYQSDHKKRKKIAEALRLQNKRTLFIANSCNFPIVHEPSCQIE
jgi:hypothetical protein